MERLARWVIRHRVIVSMFWAACLVGGVVGAGPATERLSFDFSLPGQPGDDAEKQMLATYGVSAADTIVLMLTVPEGQTAAGSADEIGKAFAAATTPTDKVPAARVVDLASTGDERFILDDERTSFALVQTPPLASFVPLNLEGLTEELTKHADRAGFTPAVTSYNALATGEGEEASPNALRETLVAVAFALVVLAFVFASFLALVPLLVAAVSVLTTFLVVLALTTAMDVSFIVQFLVALIGLGVAIDYSLLLVSRWREERDHGRSNEEAVVVAMKTAGHAVYASGATVAISLLALLVVPVPFLRSMGVGGMLIPLISVAVVLTLLPAMLSKIGPRVDWPKIRHEATASKGWTAWANLVVRHRVLATLAALTILGVMILPVFGLKIGQSNVDSLAKSGPGVEALAQLEDGGVTRGVLTPIEVLVPGDEVDAAVSAAEEVDGIQFVTANAPQGETAVVDVIPAQETVDSSGVDTVNAVRDAVEAAVSGDVAVAGVGSVVDDFFNGVYDRFPYVLGLIVVITFVLLMREFRSVLLPLKAVLLNLISLAAVFGAVTFFWQSGNGSEALFDIAGTGAVTFWIPIMIFAFLFGLSMDYEVFILARMREEYDATGSTHAAVAVGLGRTGRLVTSAALILFFSFGALASSPGTDIKVMGTALGIGILLDATVVRALLVPALVGLLGKYNWWMPAGLAKILRIEPSPLRDDVPYDEVYPAGGPRGAGRAHQGGDDVPELVR